MLPLKGGEYWSVARSNAMATRSVLVLLVSTAPRRILLFNTISVCLCEHCCQHCTVRNPGALHCESRATELVLFVAFACHCPSPPLVCKVSRSKVNLHVYDHETRRAELGASSRILDTCVYILTLEVSSLRLNGSLCGFCAL